MSEKTKYIIANFQKHLEEKNLRNLKIENWKNIFSKELSGLFTTRQYSINPNYLYRARPNLDCSGKPIIFFKNASDLWAPPRSKTKKQNRCNIKGQSLLYCSTCPTTTIFEVKPASGTELTIIKYKTNSKIGYLAAVGVKEIMTIGADFYEIFNSHFDNSSEETRILDDILSDVFKSKTQNTDLFPIYNLTNAITQIFLNNQKADSIPQSLKASKFVGLIYPSVETEVVLGANIVMTPKNVKNKLIANVAFKYQIIKQYDEHFYEILLSHQTKKIYPNGELAWELKQDPKAEYITDLHSVNHIF